MTSLKGKQAKGNMSSVGERKVDIVGLQDVFTSQERKAQGKGPIKSCKPSARGAFLDILKILGLDKYYPSKISLLDAMVIRKVTEHPTLVDLPWMIILKVLMIDFHARDQLLSVVKESEDGERRDGGGDNIGLDGFFLETQSVSDGEYKVNPLDVLVAIFTCCDNFLKQTLAQKLFVCKLAIPFLYPLGLEGTVVMSLWALRTITLNDRTMTEKPFPLVTFVRLGRPPLSKSKLMNDILRDDGHDTFFNHDCNNGTVARRLTDGLVECTWFITAGKEKEHLPDTTMLLNLRGDASKMKKQMQILQEISTVVFVIVTDRDLAKNPNTETCQQILQTDSNVILCLISGTNEQSTDQLVMERQACGEAVGKKLLKGVRTVSSITSQGKQKNASELKTEARKQLSEAIAGCSGMVMEECAQLAKKRGIITDEYDDNACVEGKVLADKVVSHLKGKPIVDCKGSLLPLQGAEWIDYCKLQKEQHRTSGKGSSAQQAEHIKQKMDRLREKQVEICHKRLTPFIMDFMSTLQNNTDIVLYFLKWMKMLLDEISRDNLPGLRREYQTVWHRFQEAKKKQQKADMPRLKIKVDDAENQLARASLGLEHLFRELGQIYEAVKGSGKVGKDTSAAVEYLPEIAARLMLKGSPLELVDGDASSVPISWVSAVLNKLEDIIGNKKLFVLSVLGIQSSGKSTLLNTMFGLQFTVSAGRCTRGAYMQLIPVDDHAELPFDYLVVVDTEGLRAPELGQLKHRHDNELATLVIGLGDVTMINIKGENTAEIKDILQIVVHAFLRMNLVTKHIKDHRTCIFVHQNVPAANADELMMQGCQKLQESLDDMAKEAAHSENIANIDSFSQIINFDVKKHVWYFSDLWHGNPPMAPANPGYSEKVDAVRSILLGEIAKGQKTFLTTSDLSIRLDDLWNGVLADDFVFSFRNSLEMKAYSSLQSKYYTLEWTLQDSMKSWLRDAEIKLNRCETLDDLKKKSTVFGKEKTVTIVGLANSFEFLIGELSRVLIEKAEEVENCLRDYFEKSNLQDIIIQWQQSKLNQLNFAVEQQKNELKTYLLSIKEARRVAILQTQKWSNHEVQIMNKAVELADKLKGQEVTDAELKNKFDAMWMSMVRELATKGEDEELRMDLVMEQILLERIHKHGAILRDELKLHPLQTPLEQTYLKDSITLNDVRKEHVSLKTTLWGDFKKLTGASNPELQARNRTVALTDNILKEISTYLSDLCKGNIKFQKAHATAVVYKLVKEIDTYNQDAHESNEYTFTIVPTYKVKLAVHVSRHCVQVFSLMQLEYNNKHGVKAKLDDYKNNAWSIFKNSVKQSTQEVMAGDLLCTQLKGIIHKEVKKEIPSKCVDEVLRDLQMTKYYLIVKIMDDLARKGNFRDYESYIYNAKSFALRWITNYTNEKMFSKQDGCGMSRYAEIAKSHISKITRCIVKSVGHVTDEVKGQRNMTMALWIQKFCEAVSKEIAVPVSTLTQVSARKVVDFTHLQRIIEEQVAEIQISLLGTFATETKYSVSWTGTPPSEQIIEKIWGCPEQCPFCHEPCADTTAGHYSTSKTNHICTQHRPIGIAGAVWARDGTASDDRKCRKNQLIHESCNYLVQSGASFQCGGCRLQCRVYGKCSTTGPDWVWHKYLEYKTYLQTWDIAPDPTNSVSKYWMWFMATYQCQLKDMYNVKLPDIPGSWMSISKEEALKDLRKFHK